MARLRRGEQVERNREAVLAAARRVFLARGYGGASLEAIAEAAGFSKGVVYSQFDSKGDLFFALLEARIAERAAENARAIEGKRGAAAVRALLRAGDADSDRLAGWAMLVAEFRVAAARDPALHRRYAALHARTVGALAAVFDRIHADLGRRPAHPTRAMAQLVLAFASGAPLERNADRDALPFEHVEAMLLAALGLAQEAR